MFTQIHVISKTQLVSNSLDFSVSCFCGTYIKCLKAYSHFISLLLLILFQVSFFQNATNTAKMRVSLYYTVLPFIFHAAATYAVVLLIIKHINSSTILEYHQPEPPQH